MIENYLHRIGHDGPVAPDAATLSALCLRHLETIPFENLDPFFGVAPSLKPEDIVAKLIDGRRGGYCYEHNLLLASVLEEIGFTVERLVARIRWNASADVATPRSHMVLRVRAAEGDFHVDVGFGSAAPSAPLRRGVAGPQETPHERYRLVEEPGGERVLEVETEGAWKPAYRYDEQRQEPIDYEAANWFNATHPSSHFTTGLIASRISGPARIVLANNRLSSYAPGQPPERTFIENVAALRAVYADIFGLDLPGGGEAEARLQSLLENSPAE